MKNYFVYAFLLMTFGSFAQETIENPEKMCAQLRQINENDRLYRDGKILKDGKFGRKSTYPQKTIDSVWVLQRKLDIVNTEKLLELTEKYGWITDERINCSELNIWIIFRHSDKQYYAEISKMIDKEHDAKRLNDFQYKLIKDHVTGKY